MKTLNVSSLNSIDSSKLVSLLRQVGKKFYLKKTSCLNMSSEEFMSDTWSDRIRIEYHGLSIVLESWYWNGESHSDFTLYYKGVEINPFQWEEVIPYAKVIFWYLSQYDFREVYHVPMFKTEIADILGLKDEIRKFEKQSKKTHDALMQILVKGN